MKGVGGLAPIGMVSTGRGPDHRFGPGQGGQLLAAQQRHQAEALNPAPGRASVTASTAACPSSTGTVYVLASGSDTSSCTSLAPCRTLDRAYKVAKHGFVVEVAAGTYPGQTLSADSTNI